MKNKELLNSCYKYFNRFINTNELIEELANIDKTNLLNSDIKETNKLIKDIKKIVSDIPNKVDELVIKEKENINSFISIFEQISTDDNNDFIDRRLNNLKKDYKNEIDSYERWFAITNCINENNYFNKTYDSLTDYELLEFIAQDIKAPFPPNLTQEEFDKLVKAGIEKDKREWLWRLAFNYEERSINFDEIVDYFIVKKDGYYLVELICAISDVLDIDSIIEKINDKELIEDLKSRKDVIIDYLSDEQYNKLIEKID